MRKLFPSGHVAWTLIALLANGLLLCGTLHAQPQPAESPVASVNEAAVPITAARTNLEIVEKLSKVLETKSRIVRVNGFDPLVLRVTALTPNRISVTGELQGTTSFVITDEAGGNYTVEVFVKGDARTLQTIIDRKFPNCSIEAFKVQEAVVLRGWVTNPEHITQITEIAEQFYPKVLNQMKVGGVQQVLLRVKVMEAQRSLIRELGMNFTYLNGNGYINSAPGGLNTLGTVTYNPLGFTSTSRDLTGSFGIVGNNSIFNSYISALHDESLLKVLAEPEMIATNGRPATMLSGGEFPIAVAQGLGTVSIEWKEFGVRLEAVPFVLGGGALRLDLQPEVSERDFANALTIGGTTVPGLTVRRVNTQVEMKFGQTLMLAGLISKRQTATTRKVPFLGELPYVGAAFSRKRNEDSETEVVITVTPELVSALDESQIPAGGVGQFTESPTDRELMAYGLVEVPKYGERCVNCGPGQSGPYIVPGLKQPVTPAATGRESAAPTDAETAAKARRFAAEMAAKQKGATAVKQVGHSDAAAKSRAREASRTSAPQPSNRTATAPQSRSASETPTTTSNTTSTRNRRPGLIEPSAK